MKSETKNGEKRKKEIEETPSVPSPKPVGWADASVSLINAAGKQGMVSAVVHR